MDSELFSINSTFTELTTNRLDYPKLFSSGHLESARFSGSSDVFFRCQVLLCYDYTGECFKVWTKIIIIAWQNSLLILNDLWTLIRQKIQLFKLQKFPKLNIFQIPFLHLFYLYFETELANFLEHYYLYTLYPLISVFLGCMHSWVQICRKQIWQDVCGAETESFIQHRKTSTQ